MSFFPYQSYELQSTKDANDVKQSIRAMIEPVQNIRNMYDKAQYREFEGEMKISTFKIQRIHGFRKPFYPFTYGTIIPTSGGTTLKIRTRLKIFVYFILLVWLAFLGLFIIPLFVDGHYQSALFTGAFFVISTGTLIFQFHNDDKETKRLMEKAMQVYNTGV